jgi:hypothetical protein
MRISARRLRLSFGIWTVRQISVACMDVTLLKMAQDDALHALKTVSGFGDL